MQPTIAEQYNEISTQVRAALLPIGFQANAEDYTPSGTNGNARLDILMTSTAEYKTGYEVRISITDITAELQNSCKRTFRLDYEAGYADRVSDGGDVVLGIRSRGMRVEELSTSERGKYNAGQFLTSSRGQQILREARLELEKRFAKLDSIARKAELTASAQRILQADKAQHGTLLDGKERDALTKWLSQQNKVTDDKLHNWITKGEKLQKRALSALVEQSKDAAAQGKATSAQLQQLADKYAPRHRRAS